MDVIDVIIEFLLLINTMSVYISTTGGQYHTYNGAYANYSYSSEFWPIPQFDPWWDEKVTPVMLENYSTSVLAPILQYFDSGLGAFIIYADSDNAFISYRKIGRHNRKIVYIGCLRALDEKHQCKLAYWICPLFEELADELYRRRRTYSTITPI